MPSLLPTDLEESTVDESELAQSMEEEEGVFKRSIDFSFEKGDFAKEPSGRLKEASEIEAWKQWCIKIMQTPRYECLAYSTDIGIDFEDVFGAESREDAETVLTMEITDALMADPYGRTEFVDDISFNWLAPDSVEVTCTITGVDGVVEDIEAVIEE